MVVICQKDVDRLDAGYSKGFDTTIIVFPGTTREIMGAVQGYLSQVGIRAQLEFPNMGKYMKTRRVGWKNAMMAAPWSIHTNLGRTLTTYAATSSGDYVKVKRPAEIDKLIEEAVSTIEIDGKKKKKLSDFGLKRPFPLSCGTSVHLGL